MAARSGKALAVFIVAVTIVFGVGLWWAQTRSYYEEVAGLTSVTIGGRAFEVTAYRGLDGATTPLKLRGCFRLADPEGAVAAGEPAPQAVPLTTPGWFDCFDAEAILAAIRSGAATPILAAREDGDGADRFMAVFPDGRAYQWRQPNDKYED